MSATFIALSVDGQGKAQGLDPGTCSKRLVTYPIDDHADSGQPIQAGPLLDRIGKMDPAPGRVLIADLPCAAAIAALREAGWHAERIGTRRFPRDGDHDAEPSGLTCRESLAALGLCTLDEGDRRRLAWERDGWAGLSALGIDWREARSFAAEVAGDHVGDDEVEDIRRELDDLILALIPASRSPGLADRLQAPLPPFDDYSDASDAARPCPSEVRSRDYEQARIHHRPVDLKPVLVISHPDSTPDPVHAIVRLELQVPRVHRRWLCRLMDDPVLTTGLRLVLETGRWRCRLTVECIGEGVVGASAQGSLDPLVARLLSGLLVTGRPLRHFGCTFFLPLDLDRLADAGDGCPSPLELIERIESRAGGGEVQESLRPQVVRYSSPTPQQAVAKLVHMASESRDDRNQRCRVSRADLGDVQTNDKLAEAQALLYFLPALRGRIFDCGDGDERTLRHWRLEPETVAGWRLRVTDPFPDPRTPIPREVEAAVQDVSLYADSENLLVLSVRVGLTPDQDAWAERLHGDHPGWWHPLVGDLTGFKQLAALQAERWLWLTKAARLVRAGFPQQVIEGKIARVDLRDADGCGEAFDVQHPFSPIMLQLLACFTGGSPIRGDSACLDQVRDDRMVVNVVYGLAGPAPDADPQARDAIERLFSLGLYVDRGSDGFASQGGYAYDRDFVAERLAADADHRWSSLGTLVGCTNYSNCFLGCGDLFCGPVARVHVPYIYGRMLLLALFYEMTLRRFDRRIAGVSAAFQQLDADDAAFLDQTREVNRIHQSFIAFTNDRWFREVTSQTQGAELFARQTSALGLDASYGLVKEKLERTDAFIEQHRGRLLSEQGIGLNKEANRLATVAKGIGEIALWFAELALSVTLVAIVVAVLLATPGTIRNAAVWLGLDPPLLVAAALASVTAVWVAVRYRVILRRWRDLERRGGETSTMGRKDD